MDKNKDKHWDDFVDSQPDLDAIIDSVLNGSNMPKSYDNFDEFWEECKAFADQYRLSYAYVEEEFVIDGTLVPIHLTFPDDPLV
jgi:hypothetical protein